MKDDLKFIDLFAGIGGFHYAMTKVNKTYKCVMSCDIDDKCRQVYEDNFGIEGKKDITKLDIDDIPKFDIICAGFPCQPFSNGGNKKSFGDKRGNLFEEIIKIAKTKKPKFMFLENVKHILKVDNGNVFTTILKKLREIKYVVCCQILSPHQLGIPQQRERVIFTCIKKSIYNKLYKNKGIFKHNNNLFVDNINTDSEGKKVKFDIKYYNDFNFDLGLDDNITIKNIRETTPNMAKYKIDAELEKVLNTWDKMVKKVKEKTKLSPTILCKEFNTPMKIKKDGKEIDCPKFLKLPKWKQDYIAKNKPIYEEYKTDWDSWYNENKELLAKKEIYGKLEWQTGPKKKNDSIWNYYIQVRQSGIRVKKTKYFPTLVAIVQTPIYGKEKRYITPRECARLQSFPDTFKLPSNDKVAYKQFGNAVNVDVIYTVSKLILDNYK